MDIRVARIADAPQLSALFYDTVTSINRIDYNEEQVTVWAEVAHKPGAFINKINEQYFFVAEDERQITGFASLTDDGYLDYLYVHKNYQRQGIANLLFSKLTEIAQTLGMEQMTADVSITARPIFIKKGFKVLKQQSVILQNIELINYKMIKELHPSDTNRP